MQKPLTLKPLNNHLVVKVVREHTDIVRYDQYETLKKGTVISVSFSNYHVTGMGGLKLCDSEQELKQMEAELNYLVGKTVTWSEGAEAGTVFKHEGEDYALVSFWQLVAFEDKTNNGDEKNDEAKA